MDTLTEGQVLTLKSGIGTTLTLEVPNRDALVHISPGDFLVVLSVIRQQAKPQKAVAVLCMTQSGPIPLSRCLISHWCARCA